MIRDSCLHFLKHNVPTCAVEWSGVRHPALSVCNHRIGSMSLVPATVRFGFVQHARFMLTRHSFLCFNADSKIPRTPHARIILTIKVRIVDKDGVRVIDDF